MRACMHVSLYACRSYFTVRAARMSEVEVSIRYFRIHTVLPPASPPGHSIYFIRSARNYTRLIVTSSPHTSPVVTRSGGPSAGPGAGTPRHAASSWAAAYSSRTNLQVASDGGAIWVVYRESKYEKRRRATTPTANSYHSAQSLRADA